MFIIKLAKHSFFQSCHRNKPDVISHLFSSITKGKAKALQAWTGPEGSRRMRLPDFKTIGT